MQSLADLLMYRLTVTCVSSLQAYYYCAIVEDVLLRFAWILTVTLTSLTSVEGDILATLLAPLEVFRCTKHFPLLLSMFPVSPS